MDESRARAELDAVLAGQYELDVEIGRGGMGIVYRARDLKLDRPVAIKVLPPHLASVPAVRDRFLREARTAAKLSHPSIVPIFRADEVDGTAFFVMGLVDGESLGDRIRARAPLAPAELVPILCDVARALGYAHGRGVVHRDIKPENILLDGESGRALVTDFGIARLADASPLTATGQVLGTVHFMSPEQVAGDALDGRSDLYSLGVVGYFALSGRLPFDSENVTAVLVAHVTRAPPLLGTIAPHVPRALAAVIDGCLAKQPAARYATGEELARALEEAASGGAAAPPLIREEAARALWARAAELQAATGATSPPSPAQLAGGGAAASATNAYRFVDARSAALEAGIAAQHVDRAAAELGLVAAPANVPSFRPLDGGAPVLPAGVIEDRSPDPPFLSSAPTSLQLEIRIPGEVPDSELEVLVDIIRQEMNDAGHVSTLGRTVTWSSTDQQRQAQVTITSRRGETTLRASERLSKLAGSMYGGIVGGGGGGLAGPALGISIEAFRSAPISIGIVLGLVGTAYAVARALYARAVGRRERQLRKLLDRVAAEVTRAVASHALPHATGATGMLPR